MTTSPIMATPAPTHRLVRRWATFLAGATLLLSGVAATIVSGIGAGSWQAFETGLVAATGAPLGTVLVVESLVALALAWLLFRQPPGPATLILALAGGPVIDLLVDVLPNPASFGAGVVWSLVGSVLIGLGVGMYVPADLGPTAQDALFVGLYRRLRWRPGVAKFALDLLLVLAGWLLGGQVGLGTVLVTIVVPPIVDTTMPRCRQLARTAGPTHEPTTTAI